MTWGRSAAPAAVKAAQGHIRAALRELDALDLDTVFERVQVGRVRDELRTAKRVAKDAADTLAAKKEVPS